MLEEKAKEFIFDSGAWDGGGDGIISIRHKDDLPWKSLPIGPVLTYNEAKVVKQWLTEGGLTILWKIADNIVKDNENAKEEHTDGEGAF